MQREEITTRNPAERAFLLKAPKRLPQSLSVPQQDRLLAALAQDHTLAGIRDYALHAMLILTGLRCSEIANLRLTSVDLEAGELRVIGKGDKERAVPVADVLRDILHHYLNDARPKLLCGHASAYLFVRVHTWGRKCEGQPLGSKAIFYIVRKTLKRVLDLDKGHPHALRHSFASRVREHGGTLQDLQEAMGHANIATTARYAHLVSASQRARMSALITGVPVQRTPNRRTKT
jgi:integrase/recombinase XerD